MANLNKIEQDYKDILYNLKPEEIEAYIEALAKKLFETYPTATSDIFEIGKYNKLNKNLEEFTDFYKSKYPSIVGYEYGAKFNELNKKYALETGKAFYLMLRYEITHLTNTIGRITIDLKYFFSSIFRYYYYMIHMKTDLLIEEVGFTEEDLEPFHDVIYNNDISSFYGKKALEIVTTYIEIELKAVESYINAFKEYPEVIYEEENTSEELIEIIDSYNKIRTEGYEYIKQLEELKEDPFKEVIEIIAESMYTPKNIDNPEAFHEERINNIKANAPTYNFKTFELELK